MITATRRLRSNRHADLIAMQGQIDDLTARWDALADCLRCMYRLAGEPAPDALRPRPRDRHGLAVVAGPAGEVADDVAGLRRRLDRHGLRVVRPDGDGAA